MPQKRTVHPSNLKDVLERNPGINMDIVAAHEALVEDLKKLGVEIKSSYNLEPPLGRNPVPFRKIRLHNRK